MRKSGLIENLKKTWIYIRDSKASLYLYAGSSIIEAVIGAILPLISSKIILSITEGAMQQLLLSGLAIFFIDMVLSLMIYFKGYFFHKIYQKTLINLQSDVAKETLKLEVKEIDKETSGLFIDRLNRDTQDISGLFMEYTYWVSYVISNLGVLIAIFVLNKYIFVYAVITSVVIFIINKKRLSKQYEIHKNVKKIHEKKTGLTSELVRGIRDIKILNANKNILKQTTAKIVETANEEVKMHDVRRRYQYLESNVRSLTDLFILIFAIVLYNNNLITIPTLIIVYNYHNKVKNLLTGIVYLSEYNKKFVVAADRIYEVIGNARFQKESFGKISKKKISGSIKFKDVEFGYSTRKKVLNKMNFEIKPNQKVAFVGKSGAGKTTIFNLITRLYHVNGGAILLDDINIEELDCDSIRNNMSIITQNPYIFNFSIKENLLLAKEKATMKEIREACKMACIDDYIMSLPDKYNTMIGENGVILSGGQRQRLAIARALLMQTEIILFDEATSALDNETQSEIQNAIENLRGEYTILIVAHRLSTIKDCDKIFVVDNGKIIASGSHRYLLKNCDFYKHLYEKDLEK